MLEMISLPRQARDKYRESTQKGIMRFLSGAPAANQTFNITNGDTAVWQGVYPSIAAHFGMAMGVAVEEPLGTITVHSIIIITL